MESFRDYYYYVEEKKTHTLSGIVLIAADQVLLVLPKKYEGQKKKWSIPKGHVESKDKLSSAKKELREEAGINLPGKAEKTIKLAYRKGDYEKKLTAYVFYSDEKIPIGDYHRDEIMSIGYFSEKDALKMVEPFFKKIIKDAFEKNI